MTCQCNECRPVSAEAKQLAEEKSHKLFLSLLDEKQRAMYDQWKWFTLTGSDGCVYRIYTWSYSGNVVLGVGGRAYCCYPQRPNYAYLPKFDRIIGQMFALMTDADNFRKMAYA